MNGDFELFDTDLGDEDLYEAVEAVWHKIFLCATLQNYLAVSLKTYNATIVPGKESLNPFGLRIVAGF